MSTTERANRQRRRTFAKPFPLGLELLEPRLNLALDVPALSSLPGANHTIYLDFDGHVTSGTIWNNGATINSPAYSSDANTTDFSPSELQVIQNTFKRVAEDFAPFRVNVTTVAPSVDDLRRTSGTDTKWGIRVVVTRDVAFACGCGGIAYIDSFNWSSDTPVFVFNTSEIGVAEAVSHEVGHALGLAHDGTASLSYYRGHGLGSDSTYWSPIMGVGYYTNVSQWDKGEYTGSNNASASANYGKGPDDLAVITTYNGFGYRADDHANTSATATLLTPVGNVISAKGLISTRTDVDYFRFSTGAGNIFINVAPAEVGANLDIRATLYDNLGVQVSSSNPLPSLNANIAVTVAPGQYFLKVEGVGAGTPTAAVPTGYSDYASLGTYSISGTINTAGLATVGISEFDANKAEGNSGSRQFRFTVTRSGTTTGAATVEYAVSGSGASPATASDFLGDVLPTGTVTFAAGVTSQTVIIPVKGETTVENDENFLVTLQNPSAPMMITTASATGTIVNDDAATGIPILGISATSATRSEGTQAAVATPFVFTITRAGNLSAPSSVQYSVAPIGTNKADASDFVGGFATNQLISFPAGVASRDITINVVADSIVEPTETFRVTLSSPTGATIGTAFANGAIRNDDSATGAVPARDLIAVADPLWMFIPPEYLTEQEIAVPVVSWVNGTPVIGDAAHEHEHPSGGCGCGGCSICSRTKQADEVAQARSLEDEGNALQFSLMSPLVNSISDRLPILLNNTNGFLAKLNLNPAQGSIDSTATPTPAAVQTTQLGPANWNAANWNAAKQSSSPRATSNHLAVDIAISQEIENWEQISASLHKEVGRIVG